MSTLVGIVWEEGKHRADGFLSAPIFSQPVLVLRIKNSIWSTNLEFTCVPQPSITKSFHWQLLPLSILDEVLQYIIPVTTENMDYSLIRHLQFLNLMHCHQKREIGYEGGQNWVHDPCVLCTVLQRVKTQTEAKLSKKKCNPQLQLHLYDHYCMYANLTS